mgnify:CR=1 FL=1
MTPWLNPGRGAPALSPTAKAAPNGRRSILRSASVPLHRSLVGDTDWGTALPLAARGVGEPFVTATGMLALMILWRCVYSLYLDPFGLKGLGFRRQQFLRDLYRYVPIEEAVAGSM